jgi:hypothetical protein
MNTHYTVNSERSRDEFIKHAAELYDKHKFVTFSYTIAKQRTMAQNNALHLWLGQLAQVLNEGGMDMKKLLKPEVDIPWTVQSAKEYLWRPIQKAMLGKDSTRDPERQEYTQIYETICRHLAATHGIKAPEWPTK